MNKMKTQDIRRNHIYQGDVLDVLKTLPDESVHSVVTSPPYWGLRDYEMDGQIGLEQTPEEYVNIIVDVFHELKRVLREDGNAWLVIGDCYSPQSSHRAVNTKRGGNFNQISRDVKDKIKIPSFGKHKDLMMMPYRVAFALQNDGWYIRSRAPWVKRNAMPESPDDRPNSAVEDIFLMAKSERYFYDGYAVRKKHTSQPDSGGRNRRNSDWFFETWQGMLIDEFDNPLGFVVNPQPYPDAHFACFPQKLIEPMILSGTSEKGCCPKCGAQIKRIIDKSEEEDEDWKKECGADSTGEYNGKSDKWLKQDALKRQTYTGFNKRWKAQQQNASDVKRNVLKGMKKVTYHWEQACTCNEEKQSPAIILDPFMGSGVTAMVAAQLGRDYIGIELNPEYIKMTERRISPYKNRRLTEFL